VLITLIIAGLNKLFQRMAQNHVLVPETNRKNVINKVVTKKGDEPKERIEGQVSSFNKIAPTLWGQNL
jgi:hypothetical protein